MCSTRAWDSSERKGNVQSVSIIFSLSLGHQQQRWCVLLLQLAGRYNVFFAKERLANKGLKNLLSVQLRRSPTASRKESARGQEVLILFYFSIYFIWELIFIGPLCSMRFPLAIPRHAWKSANQTWLAKYRTQSIFSFIKYIVFFFSSFLLTTWTRVCVLYCTTMTTLVKASATGRCASQGAGTVMVKFSLEEKYFWNKKNFFVLYCTCTSLQCFSDGRCVGTLIDEIEVQDGEECLVSLFKHFL